jgi:hypothetical protein
MNRLLLLGSILVFVPAAGFSQTEEVQHHHFAFGVGAAVPNGSTTDYLGTAPMISVRYGYRLNRFFQADAGLQLAFGAAKSQNQVITDIGTVQSGDREYMVPLGGRFIIPQPLKRMEFSLGGGGVWLHYKETGPSGGGYQINCYTCTSRGGWGGYGLGNAEYFLDSNHTFHIGANFQYIAAHTNGDAVGNLPAVKTTDHWANVFVEFGLNF